eukprot:1132914-Pelagomonas_calceolata.AAC.7
MPFQFAAKAAQADVNSANEAVCTADIQACVSDTCAEATVYMMPVNTGFPTLWMLTVGVVPRHLGCLPWRLITSLAVSEKRKEKKKKNYVGRGNSPYTN